MHYTYEQHYLIRKNRGKLKPLKWQIFSNKSKISFKMSSEFDCIK